MLENDNDTSKNYRLHEDKKFILKKQDIKKNHKNLVGKSLNIRSHIKNSLLERIF